MALHRLFHHPIYTIPRHELIAHCTEMYSIYGIASIVSSPDLHHTTAWINGNGITKYMFQRHRCCGFDSPGLPNDSAGYPGLMYGLCGTTP